MKAVYDQINLEVGWCGDLHFHNWLQQNPVSFLICLKSFTIKKKQL